MLPARYHARLKFFGLDTTLHEYFQTQDQARSWMDEIARVGVYVNTMSPEDMRRIIAPREGSPTIDDQRQITPRHFRMEDIEELTISETVFSMTNCDPRRRGQAA